MHTHQLQYRTAGLDRETAKRAMVMIHGRGANASSILELTEYLNLDDFTIIGPEANTNTWYPHSFMAPVAQNEPSLSSALGVLKIILDELLEAGFKKKDIYFLGFSQGACLASEFLARNADRYGGLFVYSGGLIGAELDRSKYQGDFSGTPVLIGCSDVDLHIPLSRVQETTLVLKEMGADVTTQVYPDGMHAIFEDEIIRTNEILAQGSVVKEE